MFKNLKKTLFISLATVSLVSAVGLSSQANAKKTSSTNKVTYAKASYQNMKNNETLVFAPTGRAGLYNKVAGTKGAKVVASKSTMRSLSNSNKGGNYFYGYRLAQTNSGKWYMKVVSFDKKYRGYVYIGKNDPENTSFSNMSGLTAENTMTQTSLPTNTKVYFANPGTKNVTWNAPKYTQYKTKKQVVNTQPFANDTLTITKAAKMDRTGNLYYYVEDQNNPSVSGWIYSKAVSETQSFQFNSKTDIKVNFVSNEGTNLGSKFYRANSSENTQNGALLNNYANSKSQFTNSNSDFIKGAVPAGYTYNYQGTNESILINAKFGDTISLVVTKNQEVNTPIKLNYRSNPISAMTSMNKVANNTTVANKSQSEALATGQYIAPNANAFRGVSGAQYSVSDLNSYLNLNSVATLFSPTYSDSSNNNNHYYVKYTLNSEYLQAGTYGQDANAYYTASIVNGDSPMQPTNNQQNNSANDSWSK
ncbi:hypothetical protein GSH19_03500 [Lactobacillus sp. S2-2]|uniref:hypothetical protein n=1 Tax=Lactobacillus sp. S2-2 TaxID=2692917 RepID=UPI001F319AC1|nr:hypothetical protein [Lactobacillus sp. S2-2]MCF6515219.1 hypothetical protein [Lactobacillus sp. S2-2]